LFVVGLLKPEKRDYHVIQPKTQAWTFCEECVGHNDTSNEHGFIRVWRIYEGGEGQREL